MIEIDDIIKNYDLFSAFVRIHAHISADGYIMKSRTKRSKKELMQHPRKNIIRNRYSIRYVNTEEQLCNEFIRDVKMLLNRKAVKVKEIEYDVCGKWIYTLFKDHGARKSKEWFIPR